MLFPEINNCCFGKQEFIEVFHRALVEQYPGLQVRWVRIYGKRWAHLYGDAGDISCHPFKMQLNQDYGICIDNLELISHQKLEEIIATLKEHFTDEIMV
jgi:hypothetical protein